MNSESAPVSSDERQARSGHRGAVVWLTGLSGSGKTTLARALERALFEAGLPVCTLDGDRLRKGLNADLGFSWTDRAENVRRVAEVAALMSSAGLIAIAALISPCAEDRRRARAIATAAGQAFIEIYLNVPLDVCEARDTKGLYRRARAGELPEFTGISSPYEPPADPELKVQPEGEALSATVERIVGYLRSRVLAAGV